MLHNARKLNVNAVKKRLDVCWVFSYKNARAETWQLGASGGELTGKFRRCLLGRA
jgi:hypothetical protein